VKPAAALALVIAIASCGEQPPQSAPVVTADSIAAAVLSAPASTPVPARSAAPSAKPVATADDAPRTRMPEIGVSVAVPPEVQASFDANRKGYYFRFSGVEQVAIELGEGAAPTTDAEAAALWRAQGGTDPRVVEQGGGGLEPWWSVTSFKVRMGVEGRPGMHRITRVSRVNGVLALDAGKHAQCTVYLEYDVEMGGRSSTLDRAVGVCKSMRPL
jgi:hypothetical protein